MSIILKDVIELAKKTNSNKDIMFETKEGIRYIVNLWYDAFMHTSESNFGKIEIDNEIIYDPNSDVKELSIFWVTEENYITVKTKDIEEGLIYYLEKDGIEYVEKFTNFPVSIEINDVILRLENIEAYLDEDQIIIKEKEKNDNK